MEFPIRHFFQKGLITQSAPMMVWTHRGVNSDDDDDDGNSEAQSMLTIC